MRHIRLIVILLVALASNVQTNVSAAAPPEQLGQMLLKSNYTGINQGYNVYYKEGPTSATTKGGWHPGIDYRARTPLPVYSPVSGEVDGLDTKGTGYGRVSVKIDGTNDYFIFLHLSEPSVKPKQRINIGDIIGITGSQGALGAPHLHVEVRTGRSGAAYYFKSQADTGVNKDPVSVVTSTQAAQPDPQHKTVGQAIKGGIVGGIKDAIGPKPTPTPKPIEPRGSGSNSPIEPRSTSALPPIPFEDVGACPFECCTYRRWTVTKQTSILHERQDGSSAAFTVKKGERVTGLTGIVITTRPGEARVLKPIVVGGLQVRAGETVYLLTYIGEGFYKVWYKGKIDEPEIDETNLRILRAPKSVWWVKIKNGKGQIGWTKETENFGNMDACG